MAWTINYTETARKQLRKLDKQTARRILDFMDERIASQEDPRSTGKTLTGPLLGAYWRYRVGDCRVICDLQDGVLCAYFSPSWTAFQAERGRDFSVIVDGISN